MTSFPNVPWGNSVNGHDEAMFSGNPGTGIVTLIEPITAGALRFDAPGYVLQGSTLTLPGVGATDDAGSFIDVNTTDATIVNDVIADFGFTKKGAGVLTLRGFVDSAETTIDRGVLVLDAVNTNNILPTSTVLFSGKSTLRYFGNPSGSSENLGGLYFGDGDARIESVSNTPPTAGSTVLIFDQLQLPTGAATGNFVLVNGFNGFSNRITFDSDFFAADPGDPQLSALLQRRGLLGVSVFTDESFAGSKLRKRHAYIAYQHDRFGH